MRGQIYAESAFELVRLGKVTGSKASAVYTDPRTKADKEAGKLSATAKKYCNEKVSEIMTGTIRQVSTSATEWGKMYEPEAAVHIAVIYPDFEYFGGNDHRFFHYSKFAGGSPDGLIRSLLRVVEIKCPEDPSNHIAHLRAKTSEDLLEVHEDAWYQLHFNMACVAKELGVSYFDMSGSFFSFCPLMIDGYKKLHEIIIAPDKAFYEELDTRIERCGAYIWDGVEAGKIKAQEAAA
jgi:hypothetical protein